MRNIGFNFVCDKNQNVRGNIFLFVYLINCDVKSVNSVLPNTQGKVLRRNILFPGETSHKKCVSSESQIK